MEHALQAFARLAHQIANRTCTATHRVLAFTKIQQGVDRAAPTEFVVQTGQSHIIAFTRELTLCVHQFFGHDEERNAFGTRDGFAVSPGNFGQHQMNDVLAQFMVAGGDPHLVALEPKPGAQGVLQVVCAIGGGAGGHIRQRRPGLWFAQAHGASESTVEFVQGKHFFLQGTAMLHEQIRIAHGEHATADADGGTRKKSIGGRLDGEWQLHATDVMAL